MKQSLQHRISLLLILITTFAFRANLQAQIIHTESFDTTAFPPSGWVITASGGPNNLWVQRAVGTFPTCNPHTGAGMARFTARNQPPGTQQLFTTPVIDYSFTNGNTPTFSLWVFRDSSSTAGDSITFSVNTSNSLTGAVRIGAVARSRYTLLPVNELSNGWYQYTFNIPSTFNTATNYILLNGTSQAGANIYIDDVQWDEYPTPCAGTPTAGTVTPSTILICGGSGSSDLHLTGGSSSNSGLVYQWQNSTTSNGPWTDFGTSVTGINSGTLTTTTFFRCYVTCSGSGLSDTTAAVQIQVSPNPIPVVTSTPNSPINFCAGSTPVQIIATGATTYSWSPSTGLSAATGDTVYASPTVNTTYTITGTDALGCAGTVNVTVTPRQAPVFNVRANRDSVCSGDTTMLHAAGGGPGGNQYLWNPGAIPGANVTVTVTGITTYTVVATNVAGCSSTDSITVNIAQGVNQNFGYSITNQTVSFHDSSMTGVSWEWLFGDGNISFSQNPTYTYSAPGTYTVSLIVSNGVCAPDTITKVIVIQVIGIPKINGGVSMNIYPNPSVNTSTIEFNSKNTKAELSIENTLGQVVYSKHITPASGTLYQEQIDMKKFDAGLYLVRIVTATESGIQQLVKQ